MEDVVFMSATRQAELIRAGKISPIELTTAYLQRIEALDPRLNSFVTVTPEVALAAAAAAEARIGSDDAPPFNGVPITIKDLNETQGVRTTFSCKAFADYVPAGDDNVVRRIKEAGFVILGKTNTPELGTVPVTESQLNGVCRNPWDTSVTPGGSSGGAAAALAAGLSPIAQGSDGGGSIRIPASCCGLFGIKPSRGRVSVGPRVGEAMHGLASAGPLARTVKDAAALLDVLAGYETGDPYWAPPPERPFVAEAGADPGRLRIALTTASPLGGPVDAAVDGAAKDAAALLESLGHHVDEADPPWQDPAVMPLFMVLWQTLAAPFPIEDYSVLEPLNQSLAEAATQTSSTEYVRAVTALHAFCRRLVAFWDDYDLVLTPTLAMTPVPVGWIFEEDDPGRQLARAGMFTPFTPAVNLSGQPAVSVPLAWSDNGVPLGSQLIGKPADEVTLIRVSAQLEEARPLANKRPQAG